MIFEDDYFSRFLSWDSFFEKYSGDGGFRWEPIFSFILVADLV